MSEPRTGTRSPAGGEAPTGPSTPAAVAAHLEALNLAGLGFAAKRLLGRDAGRVTGQFRMWARQDVPGLPALTAPFWAALSPLGIGRPQTAAAALCDQVLRGREGDGDVAARAAADCATASKSQYARAPLHDAPEDTSIEARQRRALVKAVKNYWRAVGHVYGEVRDRVVSGEHERAARMVERANVALRDVVDRVGVAAQAVAQHPASSPHPDASPHPESSVQSAETSQGGMGTAGEVKVPPAAEPSTEWGDLPEPVRVRSPLGDASHFDTRAEAFARAEPVRQEEPVEEKPVVVLSTNPVPNRTVAPIIFLLCIAGLALYVIFQVLNAPNPLTQ